MALSVPNAALQISSYMVDYNLGRQHDHHAAALVAHRLSSISSSHNTVRRFAEPRSTPFPRSDCRVKSLTINLNWIVTLPAMSSRDSQIRLLVSPLALVRCCLLVRLTRLPASSTASCGPSYDSNPCCASRDLFRRIRPHRREHSK